MKVKKNRLKKRIVAIMTASVLSIWFAWPNMAHAETITVEGRQIDASITVTASSATATISYTEGPGQVYAKVQGEAGNNIIPTMVRMVQGPRNTNPTPGGVSSSVDAPDGWSFYAASATFEYEVTIHGTTYKGNFPKRKTL